VKDQIEFTNFLNSKPLKSNPGNLQGDAML